MGVVGVVWVGGSQTQRSSRRRCVCASGGDMGTRKPSPPAPAPPPRASRWANERGHKPLDVVVLGEAEVAWLCCCWGGASPMDERRRINGSSSEPPAPSVEAQLEGASSCPTSCARWVAGGCRVHLHPFSYPWPPTHSFPTGQPRVHCTGQHVLHPAAATLAETRTRGLAPRSNSTRPRSRAASSTTRARRRGTRYVRMEGWLRAARRRDARGPSPIVEG